MLSPLDDYPVHQVAEVARHVGTTDRNFYDRYYFNCHSCSDDLFLIVGLGHYPNRGVADAFALLLKDGKHRVVRASRELGADRMDTTVGPLRVEVVRGLEELRVVLEPNEWGLEFDLTFAGAVPAVLERRHFLRQQEQVIIDTQRLAQTGCWTGQITVGGETVQVTPDRWWGTRDRSWGIRPLGEPDPPGIRAATPPGGFFWIYAPLQFPAYTIIVMLQEDEQGRRTFEDAKRVWPADTGRAPEDLGRPELELTYRSGTREVARAVLHLTPPDGPPFDVDVEPVLPCYLGVGTGYGFDADWRHGMYQGPLVVQGLTLDTNDPADRARMFGLVDSVARARCGDDEGWGLFEIVALGPHKPSGFTDWTDTAL